MKTKQCKHRFEIADKQTYSVLEGEAIVGEKLSVYVLCVDCGAVKVYGVHESRRQIRGATY